MDQKPLLCYDSTFTSPNSLLTSVYGSSNSFHENYKQLTFEVLPNPSLNATQQAQAAAVLSQVNFVVLYNTERINLAGKNKNMLIKESIVKRYPISANAKSTITAEILRVHVDSTEHLLFGS